MTRTLILCSLLAACAAEEYRPPEAEFIEWCMVHERFVLRCNGYEGPAPDWFDICSLKEMGDAACREASWEMYQCTITGPECDELPTCAEQFEAARDACGSPRRG